MVSDNWLEWVGGFSYTIKDGIVYDAKKLLVDVREMVAGAKERGRLESSRTVIQ